MRCVALSLFPKFVLIIAVIDTGHRGLRRDAARVVGAGASLHPRLPLPPRFLAPIRELPPEAVATATAATLRPVRSARAGGLLAWPRAFRLFLGQPQWAPRNREAPGGTSGERHPQVPMTKCPGQRCCGSEPCSRESPLAAGRIHHAAQVNWADLEATLPVENGRPRSAGARRRRA